MENPAEQRDVWLLSEQGSDEGLDGLIREILT